MASSAVDLQQIQPLSAAIAAMNTEMDFLNTDRIVKDGQIVNLLSANRQLSDAMQRHAASPSMGRGDVRLIDMKLMSPT